jgi:large subunit ribosomal protein L35
MAPPGAVRTGTQVSVGAGWRVLNAKIEIMPKLKTHKGAAKRFKKTGTGKVKRSKAFLRHILTSKGKKRKRKLGTATLVSDADTPKVKRMIPY